ncbi:MAG TPA: hypothetical protein VGF45_20535 [Polyangia bacterium]
MDDLGAVVRVKHAPVAAALLTAAAAVTPLGAEWLGQWDDERVIKRRLAALAGNDSPLASACADVGATHMTLPATDSATPLSSWQTIGGCGAGASTGTGAGVKWVGRNVTGGLFHVEFQANYVKMPYGYNYVGTTLISREVAQDLTFGVSIPYLYKYMNDPYGLNVDVLNRGIGDVNALLSYRFGAIKDWNTTLTVGAPTGAHDAQFRSIVLPQERQLGLGKFTGSLLLDHTMDHLWGASIVGANVNWRGGENNLGSYRAPSGGLYAYTNYLIGPFAPAVGVSATGFAGRDRNQTSIQGTPRLSFAANASIEWSTDWVAILLGASMPYDYVGDNDAFKGADGWGAWVVALGLALAPF